MRELIYIAVGGALGSVLRYITSVYTLKWFGQTWYFSGTLVVNITGCFLIGFIFHLLEAKELVDSTIKLFLIVGLLGGFTTFSSYGLEGFSVASHSLHQGLIYLTLQVALGLAAVWAGLYLGRALI